MNASVERLRWGLAGAAVLLLVVLAGFIGYGRYKANKIWQGIVGGLGNHLAGAGVHITHETDGFTYSQSVQKRTVFTLHAAKAIQHENGKWTLHDVKVTLYSKTSTDEDHIYSNDVEYDENTGVATAVGEVHMDLQAPGALASGAAGRAQQQPVKDASPAAGHVGEHPEDAAESDHIIHVRTSGLVYVRKLAVAATDQQVEFRYEGMQCTSKGAEFDTGDSLLHLLADVVMTGNVKHSPMTVHAVKADLDRQANTVALVRPVAESLGRTVSAANAVLHLRNDGSLDQAEGSGGVTMDAGTRHLTAAAFAGTFGKTSLPLTSKLTGNVVLTDSSTVRPLRSQANEVDSKFDAAGNPATILAIGAAQVAFQDRKPGSPDLSRELRGDRILATFLPVTLPGKKGAHKATSRLSELHATGSAVARGDSVATSSGTQKLLAGHAPELKSTEVSADDLRALFDADAAQKPLLRQIFGNGHARLKQKAPQGEEQTSLSETLQAMFSQGSAGSAKTAGGNAPLEIVSAVQSGNVTIHSVPAARPGATTTEAPSDSSAARAVYDGATSKLTLTGAAHYTQGETSLTAAAITVNQRTGDAEAEGTVLATMANAPGSSPHASAQAPEHQEQQMSHVTADHATLLHASQLAEFFGSDARPARVWQGASQVQAATLLFDRTKRSLSARPGSPGGLVHAVFANASQGSGKSVPAGGVKLRTNGNGADQIVRVVSPAMDYDDVNREATFTGGVRIDGTTGQAQSQRGVVFLNPAKAAPAQTGAGQVTPFGGSIRRIVLSGDVRIEQPGRTGTGEQLVYTAADSSYIFTGTPAKPPHMVDAQQGNVTGTTLLFHSDDRAIVVGGAAPGEKSEKPGRVRTETQVKQQ